MPFSTQPKNSPDNRQNGLFLLTNTEFKFDATLIGFELIAIIPGIIKIEIVSFDSICGQTILCSDFFIINTRYNGIQSVYSQTFDIIVGYNKINLQTPIKIKKGSMVYLDLVSQNARIANQSDTNIIFTDYRFNYHDFTYYRLITLYRIGSINHRFYFKCLIEQSFYSYTINSNYRYTQNGIQNFSVQFSNNFTQSLLANHQVYITNSNLKK